MVKKISSDEFQNEAMKKSIAVVDFSATWCGPCKMLAPVISQVSDNLKGKVDFYNVDVDECPDLAAKYGIQSVPSVLLFKNGSFVSSSIGFRPGEAIQSWIEENL